MSLYEHVRHPWRDEREARGPVTTADGVPGGSAYARFNSRVGLAVTAAVGTMTCAWVFTALALVSLPSALGTHSVVVIVAWVAQTLIQLVLLSIILFGQGLQAAAADARAEATYKDTEAILHAVDQIAAHLGRQDDQARQIAGCIAPPDDPAP